MRNMHSISVTKITNMYLVCKHDVLCVCHIMNVASSYHRFRNNHHIQHLLTSSTSPEIIPRECLICLSLNFLHELLPLHRLLCTRGNTHPSLIRKDHENVLHASSNYDNYDSSCEQSARCVKKGLFFIISNDGRMVSRQHFPVFFGGGYFSLRFFGRFWQPCPSNSDPHPEISSNSPWQLELPLPSPQACFLQRHSHHLRLRHSQDRVGNSHLLSLGCSFNPFEKYARQIGSFPQVGMKIKNLWNHHLVHFWVSKVQNHS